MPERRAISLIAKRTIHWERFLPAAQCLFFAPESGTLEGPRQSQQDAAWRSSVSTGIQDELALWELQLGDLDSIVSNAG